MDRKFKTEVCLLSLAIALFVIAAFFYTYQSFGVGWAASPYQDLAFAFVGCGSVLTATASVSISKHEKELV